MSTLKFFSAVLLCASLHSFAQETSQQLQSDKYHLSYPSSWVSSDQKPSPSTEILLLADESSLANDKFRENINLNTDSIRSAEMSLDEYVNFGLEQIKSQIPTAEVISKKPIELNGIKATNLVWSADFGNGMTLQFRQIIFIRESTGYTLTYSSSDKEFSKYEAVADNILMSFKFKQ